MRALTRRGPFLLASVLLACVLSTLIVLTACSGPASRPPPARPTSTAVSSAPTSAPTVCSEHREAIAAGRDEVAQLPQRLKTLLALLAGQVEVNREKYERLLRRHPAAGFNPRWNHQRARFSTLSMGPTETQLDFEVRDLSDASELMGRLAVFKDEPSWDLQKAERVGHWVRLHLAKAGRKAASKKASETCPSETPAPDPTQVKTAGLSWKRLPARQVGAWERTGVEAQVSGGLAELRKRFAATKLPEGVSGVEVSLQGASVAIALYWHAVRAAVTPPAATPLTLRAVLPDQSLPPAALPFPRRGTGWDLSTVAWIKPPRRKELVRHLDLLERSDLMRRQRYAHTLTDARKKVLSALTRCLQAVLSTTIKDEGGFPKSAISRVSFKLRGEAALLQATVPTKAHVRMANKALRKHEACKIFKGAKVRHGAKTTSLELTVNLPRPEIDSKSHKLPVGKLAIPRGTVNEIQRRAFWEVVHQHHMAVRAFVNMAFEEQRELDKRLGTGLSLALRLGSFHAQAELAGVNVMQIRTHPRRVDNPLRHRAIDIEANGSLPQAMHFLLQLQYLKAVSLPAHWTWRARKGKQEGRLELRIFVVSFAEPTGGTHAT